jgi:chaperone LolA
MKKYLKTTSQSGFRLDPCRNDGRLGDRWMWGARGVVSFFACLLLLATGVWANSSRLDQVLARLEQAEKEVRTLSFDFTQTTSLSVGRGAADIVGSALFERPNRFRVEQSSPEPQTIVSNGKVFWVYLPDGARRSKIPWTIGRRRPDFPKG